MHELTVLDLSSVLAAPSVGSFFAELGAKVIKIESPHFPDVTRSWFTKQEDNTSISSYFASVNTFKSYLNIHLFQPEFRQDLEEYIRTASIVLLNFKPKDYSKFNLTPEEIWAINPTIIIGRISGFGQDSDRIAYDLVLQAESGFMALNGEPDGAPTKMPVALIDVLAAHHLKEGILLALLKQNTSKKGYLVDVSLYDAAICSLMNQASNYLMNNVIPTKTGSLHPNIAPYGELFYTKDKEPITFAIGTNAQFKELIELLQLPLNSFMNELLESNQNRLKNRVELKKILAEKIETVNFNELYSEALNRMIPIGWVRNLDQVFKDDKAKLLLIKEEVEGQQLIKTTSKAFRIFENQY